MAMSVRNVEDVVNVALVRIGYKMRIGSIFDGSLASKAALDIYAQTRDDTLREFDWGFSERNIALTLTKSAPVGGYVPPNTWSSAFPPLPWRFEYQYPVDCIKLRAIREKQIFLPDFDPKPILFRILNDSGVKVIVSNAEDALAVYTAQITDPTAWEPAYVEALAASLARRLAPVLADLNVEKLEMQDEGAMLQLAEPKLG